MLEVLLVFASLFISSSLFFLFFLDCHIAIEFSANHR
jgi:hypothetical protein